MKKNISFLFALVLADAIFDAIVFSALTANVEEEPKEEPPTHPLIGRRYKVKDNSYIKDLDANIEGGGLYDREVIIVGEPYVEYVDSICSGSKPYVFVKVFSTDSQRNYRVLFDEGWLVD